MPVIMVMAEKELQSELKETPEALIGPVRELVEVALNRVREGKVGISNGEREEQVATLIFDEYKNSQRISKRIYKD